MARSVAIFMGLPEASKLPEVSSKLPNLMGSAACAHRGNASAAARPANRIETLLRVAFISNLLGEVEREGGGSFVLSGDRSRHAHGHSRRVPIAECPSPGLRPASPRGFLAWANSLPCLKSNPAARLCHHPRLHHRCRRHGARGWTRFFPAAWTFFPPAAAGPRAVPTPGAGASGPGFARCQRQCLRLCLVPRRACRPPCPGHEPAWLAPPPKPTPATC